MTGMQLGLQRDPDLEPKRAKTLFMSICIHLGILLFLVLNPEIFNQLPKRRIRIAGEEYDASKLQLTELMPPTQPQPRPKPATPEPPMVAPLQPKPTPQPPAPPPPPPPPPKESPVIPPDAVLAEGAKPDGTPKPSRGNTEELKAGNENPEPAKPAAPKSEPPKSEAITKLPENTNPNALRSPSLKDLAGQILRQSEIDQKRPPQGQQQGPRTGIPGPPVQENPDFSTEEPKILSPTYGYDFGPYLNQVLNRIRFNWYSLIPEIAKFRRGKVVIIFRIEENGGISNPRVVANSGTDPLDRAAFGSITASNPFPKLPSNFEGHYLDLQITFLYNINP